MLRFLSSNPPSRTLDVQLGPSPVTALGVVLKLMLASIYHGKGEGRQDGLTHLDFGIRL